MHVEQPLVWAGISHSYHMASTGGYRSNTGDTRAHKDGQVPIGHPHPCNMHDTLARIGMTPTAIHGNCTGLTGSTGLITVQSPDTVLLVGRDAHQYTGPVHHGIPTSNPHGE
jgi:hypothetical protein